MSGSGAGPNKITPANNKTNPSIEAMKYTHRQTEFQYFPEEYFSGSDITVYFGDVWNDEVMSIEFALQESVKPIYGYNSFTWDRAIRGNRIVQGSFTIAFKEAGYLYRIAEHIGMLKGRAKPFLAYQMMERESKEFSSPQWLAGAKETIDNLLERQSGDIEGEGSFADYESLVWGSEFVNDPKDSGTYFYESENQEWLKLEGFDIFIHYGPLPEAFHSGTNITDGWKTNIPSTVKAIRNIQINGVQKMINADGTPIAERYTFIARDLD